MFSVRSNFLFVREWIIVVCLMFYKYDFNYYFMENYKMANITLKFKQEISFAKREQLARRIIDTYPDSVPIIIEPYNESDPKILRKKFLVPHDSTMFHVISEIRKHILEIAPTTRSDLFIDKNKQYVDLTTRSDLFIDENKQSSDLPLIPQRILDPSTALFFYVNETPHKDKKSKLYSIWNHGFRSGWNEIASRSWNILSSAYNFPANYISKSMPDPRNMVLVPMSDLIDNVYYRYKDDDRFLYLNYTSRNSF
ncbi:Hypothetical protein HVR_LOCUS1075 [uncultured virus]|nr:Hypothetical protein HVR_LOCUS1075 [uncultured virus]